MEQWQLWAIAGAVFVVLEIFTPSMLFLNFAIASFGTAIASIYTDNMYILLPLWIVLSALSLIFLRPILIRHNPDNGISTGMGKYIGKKAKVLEEVSADSGVINIFDERWNARSIEKEIIPTGSIVIIERNEDLTMYVKKEK